MPAEPVVVPFVGGGGGTSSDDSDGSRDAENTDAASGPPTTVDPVDELWEMMNPIEPECPAMDGSSGRHLQWTEAPPICIDPAKIYTATLHTDRSDIVIDLDTDDAPNAVNNFVFLARWAYYDGVELFDVYPEWYLGAKGPGLSGSHGGVSSSSPAGESTWNRDRIYTRPGQVIEGRGVLHAIEATAARATTSDPDQAGPREPTIIRTITITITER